MAKERVENRQQVEIDSSEKVMHDVQQRLKKLQYMQFCIGFIIPSSAIPSRSRHDRTPMSTPTFRQAQPSDTARCFEIEISAYEGDEAATREKIATRISQYPQGFLVMQLDGRIVGFINSGCAHEVIMSDEAFKELVGHDPAAPNVVIMSVVIAPECQGRGYASPMMRTFVSRMAALGKQSIHLMCKERHVGLYEKLGFRYVRPSSSDHGGMSWHEMDMTL
jgi:ribosomal protein S18 acetylase RimI-like enzyme